MHREEEFSQVWGCLEVAEKVDEEVVWVGGARVFILRGIWWMAMGLGTFVAFLWGVAIREDNNFVNAED